MYHLNTRAVGDQVVGLLFTKTGQEIKASISGRVEEIAVETKKLEDSTKDISAFIKDKEGEIASLFEFYHTRRNEKVAAARPYQRQLEEVTKAWDDTEFDFNQETDKLVGEKAIEFEKGFDRFEDRFKEMDKLAEEVDVQQSRMMLAAPAAAGFETSGVAMSAMAGKLDGNLTIQERATKSMTRGVTGTSGLPTRADKAAAKLEFLKRKVLNARGKLTLISSYVRQLKQEGERLRLIYKHLSDGEKYTLDLEGLVSLGFEESQ